MVPGGAFPSYAYGYYARDNPFYRAWDEISRDRDGLPAPGSTAHVMRAGPEAFAARGRQVA